MIRASIWMRILDVFFIFNGHLGFKNDLGILDYLFPFPRLLTNLLKRNIPTPIKVIIAIPTAIFWSMRFITATVCTAAIFPITLLTHAAVSIKSPYNQQTENLKIKPINGNLESIHDLDEKDLLEERPLSSYAKINKNLIIKPIVKDKTNSYKEFSVSGTFDKTQDSLFLGLFEANIPDTPRAIAEISPQNYRSIFAAMKTNKYQIDNTLEEANLSDIVMHEVRPSC